MTVSLRNIYRDYAHKIGHVPFTKVDPHPSTGVRRVSLFVESAEGGGYGDDARGFAHQALYVSDDGTGCAEVSYYPSLDMRECYGDDEHFPGGCSGSSCGACHGAGEVEFWDVVERTITGAAVDEDEFSWPHPDDSADITYEYPHPFTIDSLAEAQAIAARLGSEDLSYALSLRAKDRAQ